MNKTVTGIISGICGLVFGAAAGVFIISPQMNKQQNTPINKQVAIATTETYEVTAEPSTTDLIEIPPKTEPEENELLYDKDNIKIYYRGFKKTRMLLYIENNSDQYLWMQKKNLSANQIQFDENLGSEMYKPHSGELLTVYFDVEKLQDSKITRVSEITFSYTYSFTDSIYNIWGPEETDTEIFTITR